MDTTLAEGHLRPRLADDAEILAARPPKNSVDPWRPYAFFVEPEYAAVGRVEAVATIFLTNRECPFRCVFCDLWKSTTHETVPRGAIPAQIRYALARLPRASHVKLYNSGNFFDRKAIPHDELPAIAELARPFETVIVENHPRLCRDDCVRFQKMLAANLEVAMGLETIHPQVLPALNKQMTLDDFQRATEFLLSHDIAVRAFVLLRPPLLDEAAGIEWAVRSMDYAFSLGVGCVSVIPTRVGNGIMEQLARRGQFAPPKLSSLEAVLETGIRMGKGRVLADLWDAERFSTCHVCQARRIERLRTMNLSQQIAPPVGCHCEATS